MEKIGVAGIVAEYNPFHNGHAWMTEQLRLKGAHTIVCVMSGPCVQRAQAAIFPTSIRAKAAVYGGADLVLRLPASYAISSAEAFGAAGVGLLCALGCVDTLAFGAETGSVEPLLQVVDLLYSEEFSVLLKQELKTGVSFAAARAAAAEKLQPGAGIVLKTPNNILGIEYLKALQKILPKETEKLWGAPQGIPAVVALPRKGAAHDGLPKEGIASASWLREQVKEGGVQALAGWVPKQCFEEYKTAFETGEVLDTKRWDITLLARLKGKSASFYDAYVAGGQGLGARMEIAVQQATTLQEVYETVKTKRFAHSRIRRLALAAALDFPQQLPVIPPFLQVLAANKKGLELLKTAKKTKSLPLSTSLAKLEKHNEQAEIFVKSEALAEDIHSFCQKEPAKGGRAYTNSAFFLR